MILHIIGQIGVDGALYQSMEFSGEGLKSLSMEDRLCMANMAIEAGAKNGIFAVDEITLEYVKGRVNRPFTVYEADEDAVYDRVIDIDLSAIRPTVAFPHLPENTKTIDEVGDVRIDQVVIGSCTNGRLSDLKAAAEILKGRKVAKHVRAIVIPATQKIYMERDEAGVFGNIHRSGLRGIHADLRAVPGRLYGHFGGRRARRGHDQPQLCRPHGPCEQRGIPGQPGGGGGQRSAGQNRGPGRAVRRKE